MIPIMEVSQGSHTLCSDWMQLTQRKLASFPHCITISKTLRLLKKKSAYSLQSRDVQANINNFGIAVRKEVQLLGME